MEWSQTQFAERLEAAINRKGWNQKKFAEEMNLGAATVSNWKTRDDATPSVRILVTAAEKLDVTPCYLAFGDEFAPMDDEECDMVAVFRKMKDDERQTLVAYLQCTTADRVEIKKPGTRTRKKKLEITADYDLNVTALSAGGASHALPPDLYEKLRLSQEESAALYGFAAQQLDAGRLEHPLTRALRKISTMQSHGIVPAELPPGAAASEGKSEPRAAASPTQDTPERQAPHPVSSHAVSPSSAPRKKKGKQL